MRICILGDYDPAMPTHRALDAARDHAASTLAMPITFEWVATDALNLGDLGTRFQGLWVAPGSPYRDEARVLAGLQRARTIDLPTFGNCGGFQFMVLEFARNVAGIEGARHAESSGDTRSGPAVIAPLACSLKGLSETLTVVSGTKLARLVGSGTMLGRYFCSYGVDPAYSPRLEASGLVWTSTDAQGHPRSFELPGRRFYLGCLFQPALDSEAGRPHPVIVGFLKHVLRPILEYRPFTEITPDFLRLTDALDRELWIKNGASQAAYQALNHLDGIRDGVIAYLDGRAVGCASFKHRREGEAEVKRVFVDPQARGWGVSTGMMQALESLARSRGIRTLVLETSRSFVEAVGLYQGLGYSVIPNYPPYEDMAASICLRKELA